MGLDWRGFGAGSRDVVERDRIVPLVADYTHSPPEIKQMLEEYGRDGVPVLAIYPPGKHSRPILLNEMYSQATLIEALRQAGPSRSADAPPARTAMTDR